MHFPKPVRVLLVLMTLCDVNLRSAVLMVKGERPMTLRMCLNFCEIFFPEPEKAFSCAKRLCGRIMYAHFTRFGKRNGENAWVTASEHLSTDPEHLLTDPEHLLTDPEHLLTDPEHLLTDPEHLSTDPEHLLTDPEHLSTDPEHLLTDPEHLSTDPEHLLTDPEHLSTDPEHLLADLESLNSDNKEKKAEKLSFAKLVPFSRSTGNDVKAETEILSLGKSDLTEEQPTDDSLNIYERTVIKEPTNELLKRQNCRSVCQSYSSTPQNVDSCIKQFCSQKQHGRFQQKRQNVLSVPRLTSDHTASIIIKCYSVCKYVNPGRVLTCVKHLCGKLLMGHYLRFGKRDNPMTSDESQSKAMGLSLRNLPMKFGDCYKLCQTTFSSSSVHFLFCAKHLCGKIVLGHFRFGKRNNPMTSDESQSKDKVRSKRNSPMTFRDCCRLCQTTFSSLKEHFLPCVKHFCKRFLPVGHFGRFGKRDDGNENAGVDKVHSQVKRGWSFAEVDSPDSDNEESEVDSPDSETEESEEDQHYTFSGHNEQGQNLIGLVNLARTVFHHMDLPNVGQFSNAEETSTDIDAQPDLLHTPSDESTSLFGRLSTLLSTTDPYALKVMLNAQRYYRKIAKIGKRDVHKDTQIHNPTEETSATENLPLALRSLLSKQQGDFEENGHTESMESQLFENEEHSTENQHSEKTGIEERVHQKSHSDENLTNVGDASRRENSDISRRRLVGLSNLEKLLTPHSQRNRHHRSKRLADTPGPLRTEHRIAELSSEPRTTPDHDDSETHAEEEGKPTGPFTSLAGLPSKHPTVPTKTNQFRTAKTEQFRTAKTDQFRTPTREGEMELARKPRMLVEALRTSLNTADLLVDLLISPTTSPGLSNNPWLLRTLDSTIEQAKAIADLMYAREGKMAKLIAFLRFHVLQCVAEDALAYFADSDLVQNLPPPNARFPPPNEHLPPPNVHHPPPNARFPPPNVNQPPPNAHFPPPNVNQPPTNAHFPPSDPQFPDQTRQAIEAPTTDFPARIPPEGMFPPNKHAFPAETPYEQPAETPNEPPPSFRNLLPKTSAKPELDTDPVVTGVEGISEITSLTSGGLLVPRHLHRLTTSLFLSSVPRPHAAVANDGDAGVLNPKPTLERMVDATSFLQNDDEYAQETTNQQQAEDDGDGVLNPKPTLERMVGATSFLQNDDEYAEETTNQQQAEDNGDAGVLNPKPTLERMVDATSFLQNDDEYAQETTNQQQAEDDGDGVLNPKPTLERMADATSFLQHDDEYAEETTNRILYSQH